MEIQTVEGLRFGCEVCPYQTKRKCHLQRHMREKHGPNENITCEFCNKVYKNERCFAQHACFKKVPTHPLGYSYKNWEIGQAPPGGKL